MRFDSNIHYWNHIRMLKLKFNVYFNHPLIVIPQTNISYKQRCFKSTVLSGTLLCKYYLGRTYQTDATPSPNIFWLHRISMLWMQHSGNWCVLGSNEWVFGLFNCVMELANYEQLRNTCIFHCIIVPRQSIIPTDLSSSSPNTPTVEDQWGWIPLIVATFNSPAPLFLIQSNTNNNTNIKSSYCGHIHLPDSCVYVL